MKFYFVILFLLFTHLVKSQIIENLLNQKDSISIRLRVDVKSKTAKETIENVEILKYLYHEIYKGKFTVYSADSNSITDSKLTVGEVNDVVGFNNFSSIIGGYEIWNKYELHERITNNTILVYPWENKNTGEKNGFIFKEHPLKDIFKFYDIEGTLVKKNNEIKFTLKNFIFFGNKKYFTVYIENKINNHLLKEADILNMNSVDFDRYIETSDPYLYLRDLNFSFIVVSLDNQLIKRHDEERKICKEMTSIIK